MKVHCCRVSVGKNDIEHCGGQLLLCSKKNSRHDVGEKEFEA